MLDIKLIREKPDLVRQAVRAKQMEVDVDRLLELDQGRRALLTKIESLRSVQNKTSLDIAGAETKRKQELIAQMKEVSRELKELEPKLQEAEDELQGLMLLLPNPPHESVPLGKDENENVVLRSWGKTKDFDFEPQDHVTIGKNLGLIDIERGAKVSGARFYYLKKEAVLLELALVRWVMELLAKRGFVPIIPPVLVKGQIMEGGGYLPTGEEEIYKTTRDDLYLVGTSEQSILGLYSAEILEENRLPLRYAGFSSCFRREAGSYGKDVRGIFRVHQFDKVEMFSFSAPEKSWEELEFFLSLEEEIMRSLKLPYQVVVMCTGDLGPPAAKKYDIEAWMPGQGRYRETHSTSNCTDFQARRLNIKYRRGKENRFLHTINGTAVAIGRTLIAILENYQNEDGSVTIPEVLRPYLGIDKILPSSSSS